MRHNLLSLYGCYTNHTLCVTCSFDSVLAHLLEFVFEKDVTCLKVVHEGLAVATGDPAGELVCAAVVQAPHAVAILG